MKYFLDTEFHEYKKKPLFGKAIDTIELISIGIVAEDGREYYAICKDFDLKAAWNSFQLKTKLYAIREQPYVKKVVEKEYWLRENVLKPIFFELMQKDPLFNSKVGNFNNFAEDAWSNDIKHFKRLINKYGKTREQIAEEAKKFVRNYEYDDEWDEGCRYGSEYGNGTNNTYYFIKDGVKSEEFVGTSKSEGTLEFYGYYADYDWVVFCWLFGKMINLPKGFPWYCRDLKQELDKWKLRSKKLPEQENEHNALADAKWNKKLYEFLYKL